MFQAEITRNEMKSGVWIADAPIWLNTEFEDIKSYTGNVKLASERASTSASTSIQGKGSVSIIAKNEDHLKNINVRDILRVP